MDVLRLTDFDFELPADLIAQEPAAQRDAARLLVVGREGVEHRRFAALPDLVEERLGKALLVVNDTQVIPARLHGHKVGAQGQPGGQVELLLCDPLSREEDAASWSERWRCLYRASKPLRPGTGLRLAGADAPAAEVLANEGEGRVQVRFRGRGPGGLLAALAHIGQVPLPPYIHRPGTPEDRRRYQTVYARHPGAVAAPTAGLHFTPELLERLRTRGLEPAAITLHVGPGTFAPVKLGPDEDVGRHVMHAERFHISEEAAQAIRRARAEGRKVLAVGTTVVRALEAATPAGETSPRPGAGETRLFIRPPYRFRAVDALLTNFHLPRSTLLMLVSAFAGRRRVLSAYAAAVAQRYRFFSYGDAMLVPAPFALEDAAEERAR